MLTLTLFSCGGSNSELCGYTDKIRVKMDIVDVEKRDDSDVYDVWLQFDRSIYAQEIQSLGELKDEPVTEEFLEINPFLHQGTTLTGYVFEVTEGDCKTPPPAFDQGFKSPR